jgi:uncharacterized membrane protein (UPF0127 family)
MITSLFLSLSLGLTACTSAPSATSAASPESGSESKPIATPMVGQTLPTTATTELAGKTFQLEVAQTPDQQQMGLMYRPALSDDRGMLFPMGTPRPVMFWMRNVPVALDMVFVNQGRIVAIAANVPPCATASCPTYGPKVNVDQVIELRAGRATELGIKSGDPIVITTLK